MAGPLATQRLAGLRPLPCRCQRLDVLLAACLIFVPCIVAPIPVRGGQVEPPPQTTANPPPKGGATAPVSPAERIANLQRSIDADAQRAKELRAELDNPSGAYAKAEQEFNQLDGDLDRLRKELKQAETDNDAARKEELKKSISEREPEWEEAKRRFELEIEARKTRVQALETLTSRIEANKALLERLRNPETTTPSPPVAPTTPATPGGTVSAPTATPSAAPPVETSGGPAGTATGLTSSLPVPLVPSASPAEPAPPSDEPKDEEITIAEAAVERLEAEAAKADEELENVTARVERLKENIAQERKLRELARQKVIEAEAEAQRLRQTYWQQLSEGNDAATQTREQVDAAQQRLQSAQAEARQAENHLDELQNALAVVQAEQIAAVREAEQRRKQVERARETLEMLSSPWSPRRIERWLLHQGVRVLTIICLSAVVLWIARQVRKRLIDRLIARGRRGTTDERENRARTLVGVFHSTFRTFVYGTAIVLVLEEFGFSVAPLLGGAAVVGLAVAFGAQSLIKDYFTGFIILLEQQYMLNDVVQIGELSGQVERITLRMTVLRAMDGKVHFIPHGTINSVTNMTHGWSRAVFDIQVGYSVDVDRVCRIIAELGRELRRDPAYSPLIIEDLVMLGVDEFQDSGVRIKFYIATRPLQQWTVRREMLRRIKARFDEEGIEIPFPQLTLHYPRTNGSLMPGE